MNTKDLTLAAVFASLYAVLVVFLASVSFGPVQLRIADCLLPLAALFGWPIVLGATIGCFVGNAAGGVIAFGAVNPMDIVFGSVANFIATFVIFALRKRRLLGCVFASVIVGAVVGGYLWMFVPPPDILGFPLQPWAAMVISVTASSLVAIGVIGYVLVSALSQPNIVEPIKARGVTVYS
ncbi:QueT transporter family protein [Candidatus Bathyarchaeota archaeon]|nr:MAG: QueT transporter family protein [Candidatus Bathyarchaeota archaeon]